MQKDNKLFDDMARMMSGAAGTMFDAKRELEQQFAAQIEKFLLKMNFVSREEFEVVRDMAKKAREENEVLKARIEALEQQKR
jgi:BMFP domain-containing protein YqiC